jgi:hypothetical protein
VALGDGPAWLDEQIRRASASLELMNETEGRSIPRVPDSAAASEA